VRSMGTTLTIKGAPTPATGRLTVAIRGVECKPNSADLLTQLLEHVPGVVRAYVNCDTEMAYVEYRASEVTPGKLVAAVGQSGLAAGDVTLHSTDPSETPPHETGEENRHLARSPQTADENVEDGHSCCGSPGEPTRSRGQAPLEAAMKETAGGDEMRTARVASQRGHERSASWPFKVRLGIFLAVAVLVLVPALWLIRPMGSNAMGADYSVNMSMTGFTPPSFSIPAGKPVSLQLNNVDSPFHGVTNGALHQFAIDSLGIDVRLDGKQSAVIDLPALEPGSYEFYCNVCCGGKVNPSMRGTITVQGVEWVSQR